MSPTSRERKYDRQLRLWAANGQQALEEAHVILLNSGPGVAALETVKNLVLPGIGRFTIQDSVLVTEADLGVNFFLEDEDVGKFRAERTCSRLMELNPDSAGHYVSEPIESFINQPDALRPFTHILVTLPVAPEILQKISTHSLHSGTPVFYIHSIGFYGRFTLQLPSSFPIVDTHPDPATTSDLRLLTPWPELQEVVNEKTAGLGQMDNEQHGHVPWLLLLLHYLQDWKDTHGGIPPQNYKEKTDFRDVVRKGMRTNNAEGSEENFEEAIGAVLKSLNPATPSGTVKEVLDAPECQHLTANSSSFWTIASAIRTFHQKHGVLPLSGALPDMKAKSADYITLQQLYKSKARSDAAEVKAEVARLDEHLQRPTKTQEVEVDAFCKSAGYIKLVRGREPHFVRAGKEWQLDIRAKAAAMTLTDPTSSLPVYIALVAYDSYAATHQLTADAGDALGKITGIAKTFMDSIIDEAGTFVEDPEYSEIKQVLEKIVTDLVNAKGGELHNISAVMGGMVAQEAIKVITKQYVPVDNVCVFDGVNSRTWVMRL